MKREQLLAKSTQAETVIILLLKCGVLFVTNMVQWCYRFFCLAVKITSHVTQCPDVMYRIATDIIIVAKHAFLQKKKCNFHFHDFVCL